MEAIIRHSPIARNGPIWAFSRGGGGGHSDAKWEIFQFSPFFSKMSFRRGRYVVPF